MTNLIGQSIGRYHILEQLGEGGMATVYKAYDTRLDRDVALKVIRRKAFPDEQIDQILKRFEREAKSLGKISHPNIVGVMDYGEHEGSPYLVMEYLPGGTLKQRVGRPAPWEESVRLLLPVARALAYAHQQGIIHRDVKPSNILVTGSGEPMLTDFGIAKILESGDSATLTATGVGIGTPEYMAPEQWTGQASKQSDIYSLGIVLYELVTGRKPYTADTPAAILLKQANDPLPRPRALLPELPEAMERILLKALAKDPQDRYESMSLFAQALESLTADGARKGSTSSTRVSSRKRDETLAQMGQTATVAENMTERAGPSVRREWEPTQEVGAPAAQGKGFAGKISWAIGIVGGLCLLGVCALAGTFALDYFQPTPTPLPTATVTASPIPNTPTLVPTATFVPTPTFIPTFTAVPLQAIAGVWRGDHYEIIGEGRYFVMELTIYDSGAETFYADIVLYQDGSLFQTNTADGDWDGSNIRFVDNDGRHYWGTVQDGRLIGQVAWGCYGCDVWGTLDLVKIK